MTRFQAAHAPALSIAEAALLPAMQAAQPDVPRNLLLPDTRTYTPVKIVDRVPAGQKPPCRAALHHITAQRAAWRR